MSDMDYEKLAAQLAKIKPGFLPDPIFQQVTRLICVGVVEIVPLRRSEGRTEVLLFERPATDPVFAGGLHTPGTVIRADDRTYDSVLDRLIKEELGGFVMGPLEFVTTVLHLSERGQESSQVYMAEVKSAPEATQFFDAHDLPSKLVKSQLTFIPQVVEQFERGNAA